MHRRLIGRLVVVAAIGLAVATTGCGGGGPDAAGSGTTAGAPGFPVTVGSVTLPQRPERIVSLSPTATEMLFAIGAGRQVVAVDDNSNYPPEAPRTTLSGFEPNVEAIAAHTPDLVVISNDTNKVAAALGDLKIPVYLAPAARTLDDSYAQLNELGKLTGRVTEAAGAVQRIKDDVAALVRGLPSRTTRLTYYYELDPTLYTVTSTTFIGSLFALVGLVNIADPADSSGGGYPQLSAEALIQANPDFVFLADVKCCQQSLATVRARPGWAGITAVRTGQIVELDDDIASRWGPRVVDLVRAIVAAVGKVPA